MPHNPSLSASGAPWERPLISSKPCRPSRATLLASVRFSRRPAQFTAVSCLLARFHAHALDGYEHSEVRENHGAFRGTTGAALVGNPRVRCTKLVIALTNLDHAASRLRTSFGCRRGRRIRSSHPLVIETARNDCANDTVTRCLHGQIGICCTTVQEHTARWARMGQARRQFTAYPPPRVHYQPHRSPGIAHRMHAQPCKEASYLMATNHVPARPPRIFLVSPARGKHGALVNPGCYDWRKLHFVSGAAFSRLWLASARIKTRSVFRREAFSNPSTSAYPEPPPPPPLRT